VLDDVIATDRNLAVKVKIEGASKYRVQFIGRGGQILNRSDRTVWLAFVHGNFAAGAGRRKHKLVSRRTILQSI